MGNIGEQFKEANQANPPNIEDLVERLHGSGFVQAEAPKKPNSRLNLQNFIEFIIRIHLLIITPNLIQNQKKSLSFY